MYVIRGKFLFSYWCDCVCFAHSGQMLYWISFVSFPVNYSHVTYLLYLISFAKYICMEIIYSFIIITWNFINLTENVRHSLILESVHELYTVKELSTCCTYNSSKCTINTLSSCEWLHDTVVVRGRMTSFIFNIICPETTLLWGWGLWCCSVISEPQHSSPLQQARSTLR